MTQISQEQPKTKVAREMQHIEVEASKSSPEVLSSPHDILGKEYEFNGVSFTVLGIEPVFYDDEMTGDLQLGTIAIINIQKQRIPVIPFQGGMARITKIQIGDEVIIGYATILKRIAVVEQAPEGWMTANVLARLLGVGISTIKKIAYLYIKSHPVWFCDYTTSGMIAKHYSPELCDIIKRQLAERVKAPEGWENVRQLSDRKLAGCREKAIRKVIDSLSKEQIGDFKRECLTSNNNLRIYYSQQFIREVEQRLIVSHEISPDGWMTLPQMIKNNFPNIGRRIIESNIQKIFIEKPQFLDHAQEYSTGNVRCLFYSPELILELCNEIKKLNADIPDGWEYLHQLGQKRFADRGEYAIKNAIQSVISQFPDVSEDHIQEFFFPQMGRNVTCFSPYFLGLLETVLLTAATGLPPEKWEHAGQIGDRNIGGKCKTTVRNIIKKLRQENPKLIDEHSKSYLDKQGKPITFYDPVLVDIIEKRMISDSRR